MMMVVVVMNFGPAFRNISSETISLIFIELMKHDDCDDDEDDDGDIDGVVGGDDYDDVNILFAGMNQLQQQKALSATTRSFLKLLIILRMINHI